VFGRRKAEPVAEAPVKEGGKGRPTPSRKDAEAAARERARAGMDKKAAARQQRQRRAEQTRRTREGMRSGDERYLPARDQGPVKRFVRDFVDSRFSFAELLLPLLVIIMVLSYSGGGDARSFANGLWTATILLTLIDTGWMLFRMRRALRARFDDDEVRGTSFYAILRVMQLRFMRMPKPKVGLGGKPKG
jgi:hypothetical protein